MKHAIAVSLLAGAFAFAQDQPSSPGNPPPQQLQSQQPVAVSAPQAPQPKVAASNLIETFNGPTIAEIYCAGFVTRSAVHASATIIAGNMAPEQVAYSRNEYIYLQGDVQEGSEYLLLRHTFDPNRFESYPGQAAAVNGLGELYQDLGRAKVLYVRKRIGVAKIESTCSSAQPGDIAVPFQERPRPEFKQTNFEEFAAPNGKTKGRIILGRDLDTYFGAHRVVYLNVGEGQGVKPGDYFRVTREYSAIASNSITALPFYSPSHDDAQKDPPTFNPRLQAGDLPRRSIGELMVLSTTANTSAALTTYVPEDIHVGDEVEMVDATAIAPPPPPASAAPEPPTISCSVSRSPIQVGETSNITCNGTAEEGHTLAYSYQASSGQIAPRENRATLTGTAPGPVTVTATAVDDRNLSAQTTVNVDVQAVAAPAVPLTPTMLNELIFKPNSAVVDNRAKAILDDDALRLQRDASANLVLQGSTNPSEKDDLATARAENAKVYLTRSKGIDPNRVQTRPAQSKTGSKVSVILMPAGTSQ